jgi:hypothetical protein
MFIAVRAGDNPGLLQDDFTSAAGGCASCHGTGNIKALSKEAPANHCPSAVGSVTDVNYCLKCHTTAASAPAFGWTVHRSHFATHIVAAGQKATCDLCHQLDAGGNFTLIGAVNSPTLKTTAAMVAKMPTYYLSAATSAFLDHTHGEQSAACASCHETAFPTQAPKKEQCFTCHGTYERLAEQSAFHHDTLYPHFGSGGPTECTACHKAHAKSVLGCNQCHSFTTRVP